MVMLEPFVKLTQNDLDAYVVTAIGLPQFWQDQSITVQIEGRLLYW